MRNDIFAQSFSNFFYEDGAIWKVFAYVPCALTAYEWCSHCHPIIEAYENLYDEAHLLVVRHGPLTYPYNYYGYVSYPYGACSASGQVVIDVGYVSYGYMFEYWLINGEVKVYQHTLIIAVNSKTTVAAYFIQEPINRSYRSRGCGGHCYLK